MPFTAGERDMNIKDVMEKATPGPWTLGWGYGLTGPTTPRQEPFCGGAMGRYPISNGKETIAVFPDQVNEDATGAVNAALAAHSVNMLPRLVEVLKTLMTSGEKLEFYEEPRKEAVRIIAEAEEVKLP